MPTLYEKYDEVTTRYTEITTDSETGLPLITYTQDIKPIIEANKRRSSNFTGTNKDDFTHVASIPNVVVQRLMQTGIWYDEDAMNAWLDDPDNRFFRTDGGRRLSRRL
jgi:hypothetical protein